ncbi:MAG: hypothetical protein WA701_16080, partial [Solirubrobacterales bacterium]
SAHRLAKVPSATKAAVMGDARAWDGGCRSKVSAPGGEGDGGGCAAVIVFVVGSAVTVWGVFQAATVVSWWR